MTKYYYTFDILDGAYEPSADISYIEADSFEEFKDKLTALAESVLIDADITDVIELAAPHEGWLNVTPSDGASDIEDLIESIEYQFQVPLDYRRDGDGYRISIQAPVYGIVYN